MSSTARKRLLARYVEASQAAARPEGQGQQSAGPDDGRRPPEEKRVLDPDVVAATELLARQARLVAKLHRALEGDPAAAHGIDEDLLKRRIADLQSLSTSKFYAYRYDRLPAVWRRVYADALILETYLLLLRPLLVAPHRLSGDVLDVVVEKVDRALITAGGGGRGAWLEGTLRVLEEIWTADTNEDEEEEEEEHDDSGTQQDQQRPSKRRRKPPASFPRTFPTSEPHGRPLLSPSRTCPRHTGWSMDRFETYMNAESGGKPRPVVFADLMGDWPALAEAEAPWKSPDYLLSKTFGGRRLVPIEVGRSYVDEGWGQEMVRFGEFLESYVDVPNTTTDSGQQEEEEEEEEGGTGYLAQHNLFSQIPSLRADIRVPDYCWTSVPPHPTSPSSNQPTLDVPQLNAWFGPARTITPLHTDGYHNLLCQVVGTKYLRLYPPDAAGMRPRSRSEGGVDMSNTSGLDVGVLEGWDEGPEGEGDVEEESMRKEVEGVEYWECILEPGDTLVIPIGWWHYVRSLSVSFSVSFWWN